MFLSTLRFARRNTWLAAACVIGCVFASSKAHSQATALSLTGVNEGAVIALPPGRATTNLVISASVSGAGGSPNVVFWLEWQGAVIQGITSTAPSTVTFTNLAAGKYFLGANLQTATNVSADVSFDILAASLQPANDQWTNAAIVPDVGVAVSASNFYATHEANEPMHTANAGGRSVWWRWQATSNGVVTVTTAGSGFDTVLAVYTGTNLATLNLIGANDDAGPTTNVFSQMSFMASAGNNYFFAVDGAVSPGGAVASGDVQLRVLAAVPPVVTINSPVDGLALIVRSPLMPTNVNVSATISDPSGIVSAQYWFDGGNGVSRAGELTSPYQLNLTNVLAGDYWFTVMAVNGQGLIKLAHAGLSVISSSAELLLVDSPPLSTNGFRFAVRGLRGPNYTLQASTNLEVWCTISAWTNFAGVEKVTDTNALQISRRFYRAVAQ